MTHSPLKTTFPGPATLALVLLLTASADAIAAETHLNRAEFLAAVGKTLVDDYSGYGAPANSPLLLSDGEMTAVLGETRYESVYLVNQNLVGDVYRWGDGTNYCSGCNGSFRLYFDTTSVSEQGGVFGVGLDIVLHKSRFSAVGDDRPGDRVEPGVIVVTFTDGSIERLTIPPDVGQFAPAVYFVGVTDPRGIRSLSLGELESPPHFWVIDNLTLAAPQDTVESLLAQLRQTIAGLELNRGLLAAFTVKLDTALAFARSGDEASAIHSLRAFIHHVEAQRTKAIPEKEAVELLNLAARALALLAEPS
jgi:hypothetical protein